MDSLKRAFKGMFKRSKKNKQDYGTTNQSISAQPSHPPPPQTSTNPPEARPPQLPPIQQNSSPISATDHSKPLPPTHPLSTGQHDKPQEAVPQNHDVRPGPPAPQVNTPATLDGADKAKEQEIGAAGVVSSSEPESTVDGAKSGDVSAVSAVGEDNSLQSPPKTDSGIETSKPEEHDVTDSHTQSATENIQANGITTDHKPAVDGTSTTGQETPPNQNYVEEKVAVSMDEPPPIKAVRAAPGMSATSGPLEDFPEGGDMRF